MYHIDLFAEFIFLTILSLSLLIIFRFCRSGIRKGVIVHSLEFTLVFHSLRFMILLGKEWILLMLHWHFAAGKLLSLFAWTYCIKDGTLVRRSLIDVASDELSKQLVGLFLLFDEVGHHFEQQELVVSFGFVYFDGFKVLPCHFFLNILKLIIFDRII